MATLLWNPKENYPSSSFINEEKTWIIKKNIECSNLTKIIFKVGSKDYALNNDNLGGQTSKFGFKKKYRYLYFIFITSVFFIIIIFSTRIKFYLKQKTYILNISFFSNIVGVQKHFCLISIKDDSKSYSPESKIILDIPTTIAFFGDLNSSKQIVGEYIHKICDRWNSQYLEKPQVIKMPLNYINLKKHYEIYRFLK